MSRASFFVPGEPKPGGSKKAFVHKRTGRPVVVEDCKGNAPWREAVAWAARAAWRGPPMEGPLRFEAVFLRRRPKRHYRTRRGERTAELHPWALAELPAAKPDATKLLRSTEDALTGILWRDDAQVVSQAAGKLYGERPGALVVVAPIDAKPWIETMERWIAGATRQS